MKKLKPAGGAVMVLVLVAAFAALVFAGDLDPPAGPDNPGSAMYTLEDAYNRLDIGAAGVKRAGGFTEPSTAPGSTGRTLDEVMDKMPAADDTDGAAPEDVAAGKIYWGLRTDGSWGQQTGTSTTWGFSGRSQLLNFYRSMFQYWERPINTLFDYQQSSNFAIGSLR